MLNEDTITFGKYKGTALNTVLKDRSYCRWLLDQKWFSEQYEYLYNKVKNYDPLDFFVEVSEKFPQIFSHVTKSPKNRKIFSHHNYRFFNLKKHKDLKLPLTEAEKTCYKFYRKKVMELKEKINENFLNAETNPFNIKAPSGWLIQLENKYKIDRNFFKNFLASYELPNLTTVVEDLKRMGGIEYKGAKAFLIAKKNSLQQEGYWKDKLKAKYGEDISCQFQFGKCFFDFLHIKLNVIYECKLRLKDFNEAQYKKYLKTLGTYTIKYLIGKTCIVNMSQGRIYVKSGDLPDLEGVEKNFLEILKNFEIFTVENLEDFM